MKNPSSSGWTAGLKTLLLAVLLLQAQILRAQSSQELQSRIRSIHTQIEDIRGLKFKHPVKVEHQSLEDFGRYLDKMLEQQIPERLAKNYGKIVQKLGLYRGPEIADFRELAKMVMQSQAAAYYDPVSKTFYVVMQKLPKQMLDPLYAHELYHGLQDQYYDLENYVQSALARQLNDDELLARQAVVEGEATYMMTLWSFKSLLGTVPEPFTLNVAIKTQAELDVEQMIDILKSSRALPQTDQSEVEKAIAAMDSIPPFLLETLVGAYLKGMAFVFEVQKKGWAKVDLLYSQPPVSSEQILHPEKWFSNERPCKLQWSAFENEDLFIDWKLLEANTIGEIQWRIIFSEHGLTEDGKVAASGWNGDIFAVLENNENKALLLLIYTCWDSEADAQEFLSAYEQLLKVKYPDADETVRIESVNNDVLIIEGGEKNKIEELLIFVKKSSKETSH